MPTYVFHDRETDEYWEEIVSIAEMEKFIEENPHCHTVPQAPMIVAGVSLTRNANLDDGWSETLSKVAEANPNTPLSERYGSKDSKTVKTREIVKKHLGERRTVPGF